MKLKGSPSVWVSYAMIVGVMGTALISPLYGLYREAWHLQASEVSLIYVIYMGGALCSLLFLGRMPDRVGFRLVMQWGLALTLAGTFISLAAWNMASLCMGRFIVGVASTLVTTSANAGLARLARGGNVQRAAMMTGFLLAFGFGLGPLAGGIIGQWVPFPLVSAYVPTLLLVSLGLFALHRLELPENSRNTSKSGLHWKDVLPRLTWPAPEFSPAFVLTCCMPFLAFGVFGLYASMSPLFLDKLVPWHGPVVSGAAIALILFLSALVQLASGRLPAHRCAAAGLIGLAASNALLMINLSTGSAILFGLGVLLTAQGHGMSMLAGMSMINRIATPGNRSGLLSTYLVTGYFGSIVPMMGIGWIADRWGMNVAVSSFCTAVILLGVTAACLSGRHLRTMPARSPA